MSKTIAQIRREAEQRELRQLQAKRGELIRSWVRLAREREVLVRVYGATCFQPGDGPFAVAAPGDELAPLRTWCRVASTFLSARQASLVAERDQAKRDRLRRELPAAGTLRPTAADVAKVPAQDELDATALREEAERLIDRYLALGTQESGAAFQRLASSVQAASSPLMPNVVAELRSFVTEAVHEERRRQGRREQVARRVAGVRDELSACHNESAHALLAEIDDVLLLDGVRSLPDDLDARVQAALRAEAQLEQQEVLDDIAEAFASLEFMVPDDMVDLLAAGKAAYVADGQHRGHGLQLELREGGVLDVLPVCEEGIEPDAAVERSWCDQRRQQWEQAAAEHGVSITVTETFAPREIAAWRIPPRTLPVQAASTGQTRKRRARPAANSPAVRQR